MKNKKPLDLVFICHEAERTGVPLLSLSLLRWINAHYDVRPFIILLNGGPLVDEFRKEGQVLVWNAGAGRGKVSDLSKVKNKIQGMINQARNKSLMRAELQKGGILYVNTVAALRFFHSYQDLFRAHHKVLHVHEMPFTIQKFVPETIQHQFGSFDKIIVVNKIIEHFFASRGIASSRILRVPEYLNSITVPTDAPKQTFNRTVFRVISIGLGSWRKGIDLFVQTAYYFNALYGKPFEFIWVGKVPAVAYAQLNFEIHRYGLEGKVKFSGEVADTRSYLEGSDVFFLSSREDPYPLVMLEAAVHYKPVLYFAGSGGADEFVHDKDLVIPAFDVAEAARRLVYVAGHPEEMGEKGRLLHGKIASHSVDVVAKDIFEFVDKRIA